jgi:hypothetical protein
MYAIRQKPKLLPHGSYLKGFSSTALEIIYSDRTRHFLAGQSPRIGIAALKKTCAFLKR